MDRQQVMSVGAMLALAGSLGVGAAFGGSQGQSSSGDNKPSEFGRVGNQGEGFGKQDSIKGQGQNPESTIKQDAQVTLGGARPYVEGQVLKVQGDDYLIRDFTGSEIHLRVNKDTNMDCATPGGQGATMSTGRHSDDQGEIPPTSHMQEQMSSGQAGGKEGARQQEQIGKEIVQGKDQKHSQSGMSGERMGDQSGTQTSSTLGKDSGGNIARGSGFTIGPKGGCAFKVGDKVKAEVSDLGTVLYIKSISDKDMGSRQVRSGQMIPHESDLMPGDKAAAQQQAQRMKPGSVPAPPNEQNPELITPESKQTAKATTPEKSTCEGCSVLRGLVLLADHDSLLVRDASKKEVRIKIDKDTSFGQVNPRNAGFLEGDRIEAYVTSDGRARSVGLLKQTQGIPGAEGDVSGG
jgi:hypothetical protein